MKAFTTYLHTVFFLKKKILLLNIFLNDFKICKPRDLCTLSFLVLRVLGMVIRDCDIIYHPNCVPNQKKYYRSLSENFVQRLRTVWRTSSHFSVFTIADNSTIIIVIRYDTIDMNNEAAPIQITISTFILLILQQIIIIIYLLWTFLGF